jgi:CRP/FNR family cyclic AMP-dependent transcriptional regulator
MLSDSPHRTSAIALTETSAIEVTREDLAALLQRKPMAGLDMLTMTGRQFNAAHDLVRTRAARNPNEVIAEQLTVGDRLPDALARLGGSWSFIIVFAVVMAAWVAVSVVLAARAWDPYPFILLNLVLSMLAAMQGRPS